MVQRAGTVDGRGRNSYDAGSAALRLLAGFTVGDAPFCYAIYGGEFEAKVKVTGDYKTRFDQAGLMLRIDAENYIKAGVEFVDGKFNLSTVVTHGTSDWSIIPQDGAVPFVWIKAVRP